MVIFKQLQKRLYNMKVPSKSTKQSEQKKISKKELEYGKDHTQGEGHEEKSPAIKRKNRELSISQEVDAKRSKNKSSSFSDQDEDLLDADMFNDGKLTGALLKLLSHCRTTMMT